jgi:lipoprotein NlpD
MKHDDIRVHTPSTAAARLRLPTVLVLAALLGACASSGNRAPVEDRRSAPRPGAAAPMPAPAPSPAPTVPAEPVKPPPPGIENAGKPGYYTVRPGDTLIRIATDNGHSWRDVARWNNIENPNLIEVGQVLRVVPPGAGLDPTTGAVTRPVAPGGRVENRPLDPRQPGTAPAPGTAAPGTAPGTAAPGTTPPGSAGTTPSASAPPNAPAPAPTPAPATGADDDVNWMWPAQGPVATPFDDVKSKGLAITGKAGDPVYAAADGRVVYAGAGLRGYGNLVIVKHNNTYLTAYAHNQALLVKEDQVVRRGQKIAEMGSSDADRVQLHFEIRRQGKPIDPARLLPPR